MATVQSHPHFERISAHALLYTPLNVVSSTTSNDLIIFCPWLGATPKHIAKYAVLLTRIAPSARILLLPSTLGTLFSPRYVIRQAMQPAVSVVQSFLNTSGLESEEKKVFIYCFSNGGCFNIIRLLRALQMARGIPLTARGIVLDSCPGRGNYAASVRAMELSLPKAGGRFVRWPVMLIVRIVFAIWTLLMRLGWKHPIESMREELFNDTLLIGGRKGGIFGSSGTQGWKERDIEGSSTAVRARYIYSKADPLVKWSDVKAHIGAARQKGWVVDEVVFEDSAHCAHYLKDPEAYEKALDEMWRGDAMQT